MADRVLQFDVVTSQHRKSTVDDLVELFFELVGKWHVTRFLEIGAKDASASRRATAMGLTDVVAFEANPFTHRRFRAAARAAGVVYEPLALADGPAEIEFFVRLTENGRPAADGQGSLYARSDHPRGHRRVSVDATTLDTYLRDRRRASTALWADVEGALGPVLCGARETLASTDIALVEVEERPYWHRDQWLRRDVDAHLAAFDLVPIARDQQSPYQYNVLYVRRARLRDPHLAGAMARWHRAVTSASKHQTV